MAATGRVRAPGRLELASEVPGVIALVRCQEGLRVKAGEVLVEIKAASLPASVTNKPALFIDRIVLRKQSPEKLDEVRLTLRAVGGLTTRQISARPP